MAFTLKPPRGSLVGIGTLAADALAFSTDQRRILMGDGTTNHVLGVKINLSATAAPTTGDDDADGYSIGSLWVDVTNDVTYQCVDSTTGAAVWKQTSNASAVTSVAATAPVAGFTVSGSPITSSGTFVFALSDDLAALEGMSGTGLVARTASNTYAQRTLTGPAAGISVSNGDGVSGNPTLALANDLAALEALTGTSTIYYRSGTDTWSAVTIGTGLSFSSGTLSSSVSAGAVPNLLHNGGFEVWQRGTAFSTNDDNYAADRWYILSQSSAVGADKGTTNFSPLNSHLLTQTNASAQRAGVAHIVESRDTAPYAKDARTVRFQFSARSSTSTAIRFAIIEWTGTADSVTSDVVNNWASSTYTAGNFFLGSNLTVTAVGSGTANTTAADFAVTGTVSTSAKNLIVFVWSENTMAQNVTLEITKAGLYDGTSARDWLPRSLAEEIALCQRYYHKSYAIDTAPGTATDVGAIGYAAGGTAGEFAPTVTYPVRMRATPTYTIYSTNSGTSSRRYNASAATDETVSAFNLSGPGSHSGMNLAHTSGQVYRYHFTASAEL